MTRIALALAATALVTLGCEAAFDDGPGEGSQNPKDIEADFPALASGQCGSVAPRKAEDVFSGVGILSLSAPAPGTTVAFDGVPHAEPACTQAGCSGTCCNNPCGWVKGCPYTLRTPDGLNQICLDGAGFGCGGTDCSPWCSPFSTEPAHTYRLVGQILYAGNIPIVTVTSVCRLEPEDVEDADTTDSDSQ
jgi:hypothetical protein